MTTEAKIDEIYKKVFAIEKDLAVSITHQKNHVKVTETHTTKIETLEANKNQSIGKKTLLSSLLAIVAGSIGAWITHLLK